MFAPFLYLQNVYLCCIIKMYNYVKVIRAMKLKKKRAGLKINYQIFRSFLFSLSVALELISLVLGKTGAIVVAALAYAAAVGVVATTSVKKIKNKDWFNLDHATVVSTLLLFCMGAFYQALLGLQIYIAVKLIFDASRFFVPKTFTVSEKIKDRKYHVIHSGEAETVSTDEIRQGDMLELYSGEVIPVDGIVKAGTGTVNTANITGESKIVSVSKKDKLYAGYTLLTGNVIIEVTESSNESLMKKSLDIVNNACKTNTQGERIKNKMFNTLSFVFLALGIAFVVFQYIKTKDFDSIKYGIPAIILISSLDPVKIVVSDAYKSAIYRCLAKGIVVNKKQTVEKTLNTKGVFFEPAGVLTSSETVVHQVCPSAGISNELLLKLAAYGRCREDGGYFKAIAEHGKININYNDIVDWKLYPDGGVVVKVKNDIEILSGSADALRNREILNSIQDTNNILCVAVNGNFIGYIEFDFEVKKDIRQCVDSLRFAGIKNIAMVTKEVNEYINDIAVKGGIEKIYNLENTAQINEIKRTVADGSVLFASRKTEETDGFNLFKYGDFDGVCEGYVLSDNLSAPVNYVNIMKDCKVVMTYNFVIGIIMQIIVMLMAYNLTHSIWLMIFIMIGMKKLQKINCINLINKI